MNRSLCGPHPVRWWAGAEREEGAPLMHGSLAGLPSQSTDLCGLSLGPFERGPGEVLLQWVPLSPPPSPSWPPALLTYLPDQTRWARGTANPVWPPGLCDPSALPPRIFLLLLPSQGELSAPPELSGWNPPPGKSPFHISSDQNTPTFQGPASVLPFLSILPSATRPYTFLDTSRTFPCQLQLPLIHALLLPTYYLFTRIWRFSFSSSETGQQHCVCTFLYLLSLGHFFVNRCSVRFVTCLQRAHHSGWGWGSRRPESRLCSLTDKPPHH